MDLNEIEIYIAKDNLTAALALHERFSEIFQLLSENQKIGLVRSFSSHPIRSFPVSPWKIISSSIEFLVTDWKFRVFSTPQGISEIS